jgi:hypothetical protein
VIALIHAVHPAIPPVEAAFQRLWPNATRFNLIDDGLSAALEREGGITPSIDARIRRLAEHARDCGAQGILFTCSAFGPAIEGAAAALAAVPVLKPNEPMFREALGRGLRIGMVATFAASVASMELEFRDLAAEQGSPATLETVCVPQAMAAARAGDVERHDALVAEAVIQLAHCDAVMLAHFSTATAAPRVEAALGRAVLTAPDAAVLRLRQLVQPLGGAHFAEGAA